MTEYDNYMDSLAQRISKVMEGEQLGEVVFACAGVIIVCLMQLPPEIRDEVWAKTMAFVAERKDQPVRPKDAP